MAVSFALAIAWSPIGAARAAVNEFTPTLGQSVRLRHEAVGCGTFAELLQIANITVQQGSDAALAQMAGHDCRLFKSFHGEIVDRKEGAACIIGIGNSRCLWFVPGSFEPARGM
jgi:hypothetical protein